MRVLPSDPQMYALHFTGERPWPSGILEGLPDGRGAVFHGHSSDRQRRAEFELLSTSLSFATHAQSLHRYLVCVCVRAGPCCA
jgi:hypothetical protein